MGLLDWLFGRRQPVANVLDRVWLTEPLLWQHLRRELDEELNSDRHVVLVAHFPERWDQLVAWLNAQELDFEDWQPLGWKELRQSLSQSPARIWLLPATDIPKFDPQLDEVGPELSATVMATEHHPHPEGDQPLHDLALGLPAVGGVVVQLSLDQALFSSLTGLPALLQAMGMETDECIESPMVCNQISRLQNRIGRQVRTHGPADSASDWMKQYVTK